MLKEAMLYEQLPGNKVRCDLCGRRCTIYEGSVGFCLVRKNEGGRLYSLVYAKACSACVDPITKKPLSHFHPGSLVMSIATVGCNFRCRFCLDGEVLLPLIADGKLKLTKAKELDLLFQKNREFVNVADCNLYILGFTGLQRIVAVSRRKPDDVICELVTERGKSVRLTEDHRVMVWSENKPCVRRVSEIKVGDKVRTGIDVALNTDKTTRLNLVSELADKVPTDLLKYIYVSNMRPVLNRIRLKNHLTFTSISSKLSIKHNARHFSLGIMPIASFAKLIKLFGISDYELLDARITVRGSPYRIPVILPLTPHLMRLLGYFVAEGNYGSRYNLVLTNKNEALLEDMRRCIRNSFNTFITESRPKGRTPQLIFGGKVIHLTFKYVFGIPIGSANMKIPDIAFNVDKILLKEFLSGYMTGDGILCQRKNRDEVWVRFVTASNLLKTQLCFLLTI
ncbi:MAG: DNA polymerase [Candidatus Bathyarchaeota archaeon BA1]|nr:MAG: DNA polymerase [Candidatus Bathyarchaeota archaeon BA1]